MTRRVAIHAAATLLALGLAAPARAQGGPMPTPAEIERRIKQEIERLPSATATNDALAIRYKQVPTDPKEVIRRAVAAGQLPPGIDPDQAVQQFLPVARPYIEKAMGEIGTVKVLRPLAYRSQKLPAGEYVFGLLMQGVQPIGIRIADARTGAELRIPLRSGRAAEPHPVLLVELDPSRSGGKPAHEVRIGFDRLEGRAGKLLEQ
ncbi:MAG: hypothetical protein KatS3mg102_1328 [Planctomycetota bacterium]|nr:MAG: hypothetical protein KatS3mg102_1328 [Planctomycetota bacterium]